MPGAQSRFCGIQRSGQRQLAASFAMLAVVAAVLTSASVASAAPPSRSIFWVASGGTSRAADASCRTAAYSTIASAVTAAEAASPSPRTVPEIKICPGTYAEQVTITKEHDAHPGY